MSFVLSTFRSVKLIDQLLVTKVLLTVRRIDPIVSLAFLTLSKLASLIGTACSFPTQFFHKARNNTQHFIYICLRIILAE